MSYRRPPPRAWPLLAATALLMLFGGNTVILSEDQKDDRADEVGLSLAAVGLVILGSWLTVELRRLLNEDREGDDDVED